MNYYYLFTERAPAVGQVTLANVTEVREEEGYLRLCLTAYGGAAAHMTVANLVTKKRLRSLAQVVRVGQTFPVAVLAVEGQVAEVSRKAVRAGEGETAAADERRRGRVSRLLAGVVQRAIGTEGAERTTESQGLMDKAWALPTDALEWLTKHRGLPDLAGAEGAELERTCAQQLKSVTYPLRAVVELTTIGYGGIDDIKEALRLGGGKAEYVGDGLYALYLDATGTLESGKRRLNQAAAAVVARMEELGGKGEVKQGALVLDNDTTAIKRDREGNWVFAGAEDDWSDGSEESESD